MLYIIRKTRNDGKVVYEQYGYNDKNIMIFLTLQEAKEYVEDFKDSMFFFGGDFEILELNLDNLKVVEKC